MNIIKKFVSIFVISSVLICDIAFFEQSFIVKAASNTWYVSPSGSDKNDGSLQAPFATIVKAQQKATEGDTVCLRSGTYKIKSIENKDSSYNNVHYINKNGITYKKYEKDTAPAVLDFSGVSTDKRVSAFLVRASDVTFENIEVKSVPVGTQKQAECFRVYGTNVTFNKVSCHDNQAIGFYFSGGSSGTCYRCDAYNNIGVEGNSLGNMDGFGSHGLGVLFKECRSWNNSDDGYDCIDSDGPNTFDSCWAFNNRGYADGNGFKVGGWGKNAVSFVPPIHTVHNCLSVYNGSGGFYSNHQPGQAAYWTNNTAYNNPKGNFSFIETADINYPIDIAGTREYTENNLSYHSTKPALALANANLSKENSVNNSWDLNKSISDSDFQKVGESNMMSELTKARKTDGSLPDIKFMQPKTTSVYKDLGCKYSVAADDIKIQPIRGEFTTVDEGYTAVNTVTYKITNYGTRKENNIIISLGGEKGSYFKLSSDVTSGFSLNPGESKTFTITFPKGRSAGVYKAAVIAQNDQVSGKGYIVQNVHLASGELTVKKTGSGDYTDMTEGYTTRNVIEYKVTNNGTKTISNLRAIALTSGTASKLNTNFLLSSTGGLADAGAPVELGDLKAGESVSFKVRMPFGLSAGSYGAKLWVGNDICVNVTEITQNIIKSTTPVSTVKPTAKPTTKPTTAPAVKPTTKPTAKPTQAPTSNPTIKPTSKPATTPTVKPTAPPENKFKLIYMEDFERGQHSFKSHVAERDYLGADTSTVNPDNTSVYGVGCYNSGYWIFERPIGKVVSVNMDFKIDAAKKDSSAYVSLLGSDLQSKSYEDGHSILDIKGEINSLGKNGYFDAFTINGIDIKDKAVITSPSESMGSMGRDSTGWISLNAIMDFETQKTEIILTRKSDGALVYSGKLDFVNPAENFKEIYLSSGTANDTSMPERTYVDNITIMSTADAIEPTTVPTVTEKPTTPPTSKPVQTVSPTAAPTETPSATTPAPTEKPIITPTPAVESTPSATEKPLNDETGNKSYSIKYEGGNGVSVIAEKAGTCYVIFAAYKDDILKSAEIDRVEFENKGEKIVTPTNLQITEADTIKVYIWKSVFEMIPASEELVISK